MFDMLQTAELGAHTSVTIPASSCCDGERDGQTDSDGEKSRGFIL